MSKQYPFPPGQFVLVGKISKAHGLKGELKTVGFSGNPEDWLKYSRVALVADDGRMTSLLDVTGVRLQGKGAILKLASIDTRDEADLTAAMGVLVAREDLAVDDEQALLQRLLGCTVKTVSPQKVIGTVERFFSNGAQQIMIIRGEDREVLVPLVDQIIVSHDDTTILIDPPPGLIEINDDTAG